MGNPTGQRRITWDHLQPPPVYGPPPPPKLSPRQQLERILRDRGQVELWEWLKFVPETREVPAAIKSLIPRSDQSIVFQSPLDDTVRSTLDRTLGRADKRAQSLIDALPEDPQRYELWLVYANDGSGVPNSGGGSDQGPTAMLRMFVRDRKSTSGLTTVGITIIDMHTPRPVPIKDENSSQTYSTTGPNAYSGIASLDFELLMTKQGTFSVTILGSVGVDSKAWGKLVQDFIHKQKFVDSPLFPWPPENLKLFAQGGTQVLWSPMKLIKQPKVAGIRMRGRIEIEGTGTVGTHRTESSLAARYIMKDLAAEMNSRDKLAVEIAAGGRATAFMRYNDGSSSPRVGYEGGPEIRFYARQGRWGAFLAGCIIVSQDPTRKTDLPAGSAPVAFDLANISGPEGAHMVGTLGLECRF
ncbi:MAG: hypothetical protein HY000_35965 [Planctomycetes bacterium]|nr:hypothetical protein [Planctomycetota bacterium]